MPLQRRRVMSLRQPKGVHSLLLLSACSRVHIVHISRAPASMAASPGLHPRHGCLPWPTSPAGGRRLASRCPTRRPRSSSAPWPARASAGPSGAPE
eukprot:63215-Prorocentrum_minimum.AAC.2